MLYDPRELGRIRNALVTISALAWIVLLLQPGVDAAHSHEHADTPYPRAMANWLLMLAAMMAPVLTPSIYHVRIASFAERRMRSTLLFVAGYAGVWTAAGLVSLMLAAAIRSIVLPWYAPAAATLAAASVWQCSPIKQACLNRCHDQKTIAAFGAAADLDALRFGTTHGIWCVGSCWLWMLAPMMLPQLHVAAMAMISVLIFCERLEHAKPRRWQLRGFRKAARFLAARANAPGRAHPQTGSQW